MQYFILLYLFISSSLFAQVEEIEQLIAVEEFTQMDKHIDPADEFAQACEEGDDKKSSKFVDYLSLEVDPVFSFSVNHYLGNFKKSEKEFFSSYQSGFQQKWTELITPKTQAEREQVMAQICAGMSQEDAIAFAGYIGGKNSNIYDYDRVSGSGLPQENEHIPMDSYYQTHRNIAGIDTPGGALHDRVKMGVCGDSAMMVANFLAHCGFKCEDLDISSYRTDDSGHVMVAARGENGEFFTANWSEATSHTNENKLTLNTADPRNVNTGSRIALYDCNGRAKGQTATPLGNLLMLAHGNDRVFNAGQNFSEVKIIAMEVGLDELSVSAFSGSDNESGQTLQGVSAKMIHQLGDESELIQINMDGSLVVGKARREIQRYENYEPVILEQDIISLWAKTLVQANINRNGKTLISPYIGLEGHYMNYNVNITEEDGDKVNSKNQDGYLLMETGLKIKTDSSKKIILDSDVGVASTMVKDSPQRGGVDLGNAPKIERRYYFKPDLIYADAKVYTKDDKGVTGLSVQYNNLFLMKRTLINADVYKEVTNTQLSAGYRYQKLPSTTLGFHGLGVQVKQDIPLRRSSLTVHGGTSYYFVKNPENSSFVTVGLIYRLAR